MHAKGMTTRQIYETLMNFLLLGAAIEDDGIAALLVRMDDSMAGGLVAELNPASLHARLFQHLLEGQTVPVHSPCCEHLLSGAEQDQCLIEAFPAAAAPIVAGSRHFTRSHRLGKLAAMINMR